MTQQEINELVKTIAESDDICTAILMIKNNEKEYKQSDFYKQSKIDLMSLVEFYKKLNPINLNGLKEQVQELIDSLSLDKIESLFNQFIGDSEQLTQIFGEKIEDFKELIK